MREVTAAEAAIAIARAAEDGAVGARVVLRKYIADGVDPAAIALAASRMLATADRRITRMRGADEGSWLNAVALRAHRQRS